MRLTPFVALFSALVVARADEPSIIAKARAYLGPEDTLSAVTSVHLSGSFVSGDAAGVQTPSTTGTVDIVFQRPWQHHMTFTAVQSLGGAPGAAGKRTVVRTIALDDYDAWERVQVDSNLPSLNLLSVDQIRVLRADVWENLGYFRGIEATGGSVEDQGAAVIEGVACEKIAFIHSPTVVYYRYFDKETGRLVYTETASGLTIREQGTIVAGGIKFPQKIVTVEPARQGAAPKSTVLTLDRVSVNDSFPPGLFAVPLPSVLSRPRILPPVGLGSGPFVKPPQATAP